MEHFLYVRQIIQNTDHIHRVYKYNFIYKTFKNAASIVLEMYNLSKSLSFFTDIAYNMTSIYNGYLILIWTCFSPLSCLGFQYSPLFAQT